MRQKVLSLRVFLTAFFMDTMQLSSNRIKLIWFSAFTWATTHFWFGTILPIVREISIIYYRQNGINGTPINLDSPYAQSILNSTDMAFTGIVVAYVASNWSQYKAGRSGNPEDAKLNSNIKDRDIEGVTEK